MRNAVLPNLSGTQRDSGLADPRSNGSEDDYRSATSRFQAAGLLWRLPCDHQQCGNTKKRACPVAIKLFDALKLEIARWRKSKRQSRRKRTALNRLAGSRPDRGLFLFGGPRAFENDQTGI